MRYALFLIWLAVLIPVQISFAQDADEEEAATSSEEDASLKILLQKTSLLEHEIQSISWETTADGFNIDQLIAVNKKIDQLKKELGLPDDERSWPIQVKAEIKGLRNAARRSLLDLMLALLLSAKSIS